MSEKKEKTYSTAGLDRSWLQKDVPENTKVFYTSMSPSVPQQFDTKTPRGNSVSLLGAVGWVVASGAVGILVALIILLFSSGVI